MCGLKICLWIAGIACLLCVFGVFMPVGSIESFTNIFGAQEFPDAPVFLYLLRTVSATFAAIGVFFIILAMKPMSYGIMVPFSGLGAVAVGVVCLITGIVANMPKGWYLGDALSCVFIGILILIFYKRARLETEMPKQVEAPQQ